MIPYVLHVTVILTVCFGVYKFLLQKATFYRLNRWTLLSCLALSFILPLLPVPRAWTWRPAATADPVVVKPAVSAGSASSVPFIDPTPPPNFSHKKHHVTTKPAVKATAMVDVATSPVTIVALPATPPPPAHPFRALLLQGLQLLSYVYCLGLLVLGLKFVGQFFLLCYQSFSRPVVHEGRYRIVQTVGDRGPCTFGNTIFINPALYDRETFQQILVHEKIHVSEGHTVDILFAELAVVFQWFNPFVWLYRREVENNLEFLTDRAVLEHPGVERSAYQLSLLRVSAPHLPFSITNNYNQSLLKRRIVMMNSQQTAKGAIWRYAVLLPILTALVCVLNKPAAIGQTTTAATAPAAAATATSPATATPSASASATTSATATAPATAVIRPARATTAAQKPWSAEPAVTATIPDTTIPRSLNGISHYSESSDFHESSPIDFRQGSWFLTVDSDEMEFVLRAQSGENTWRTSFTIKKSEINPFPGQGTVEFKLVREAGTMTFKGSFDGEQGLGHFQFQPDETYFSELQKLGVEEMDDHTRNSFFIMNVSKDFVRMINRSGYTPISQRDLIGMAIHRFDEPTLKYWKTSGVEGADEVRNLFILQNWHVDPAYVEELKKAGYIHLTVQELTSLKMRHVDGNYARAINADVSSPVSPEELATYKLMQIDSGYLSSLRKVGYDHLSASDVRMLSGAHITADYVKGFQDAGFSNLPVNELVSLKYRNASPEDAKAFRRVGYTDLDLNRITQLKGQGITPDFVDAFHKIGYDNIPAHILFMLKTSGVDADYVAKMKKNGLNSPDLMKYVQLKRDFN